MWKRGYTVLVVFVLSVSWLAAFGQTRPSRNSRAQIRFAQAVDQTFHKGRNAKLPPHISTLLGISQEQECPVMQAAERNGTMVRGLDVSVANQNDVVLFVVDETANDQTLYLTSTHGTLRKVVSVRAGEGKVSRITDDDRETFEKEKKFWIDRLAGVPK